MIVILYKNGTELKRGEAGRIYPFKNMGTGKLENGLEWKILVDGTKPTPTELENLIINEVDNNTQNADHSHLKQIDIEYSLERKSDAELTQLLGIKKKNANANIFGVDSDREELMILAIYALIRKSKGQSVPAKANAIATIFENMALKIIANSDNLDSKLQDLANITDINLGFDNG